MGLDQYAYFVDRKFAVDNFTIKIPEGFELEERFYWRKNRHLHGWMEELFRQKGGEGDFNCREIRLTKKDLTSLEKDIKKRGLKDVHGFFWGDGQYTDEKAAKDLSFVQAAKEWIGHGGAVYYTSWW